MVMEYCPGGDLLAKLKKQGKFDERTVKYYAAELVLALEYLHDKLNIIHRYLFNFGLPIINLNVET